MLERLVESTKTGDVGLGLNDSSNSVFAKNSAVERSLEKSVNFVYDSIYGNRDTSEMSGKEKVARLAGASALIAAMGTSYILAESVCRLSELAVRGTGKLANLGYEKAANQWTNVENFGQKVSNNYKNLRRKIPKSVKNLFHKVKDYLVVGLSVAAIGLSYGGIKSCSEEPEPAPIIEPAPVPAPDPRPTPTPEQDDNGGRIYVPQPRPDPRPAPEIITEPQCQTPDSSNNIYQIVADAAETRAVSQRTNYAYDNAPTSPLEGLTSNTEPGTTKINWLKNRNKCNQFVGDALVEAGHKAPTYEMDNGSLHYKEIEQFPHEERFFDKVTDFCDIRPGQVIVIDYPGSGEDSGHGEIIHSVDYDNKIVWSFGAHQDGAYKKKYELFQDADFSDFRECWEIGIKDVYVLKPK
jgi:hypothetical protein